ncbi:diamine N-acetyltransferase [Prevotellaceae bacterium MN60]|nr:diamine N-acetyltransferase [Prevotellaceae bacterium MN60]
MTLRAIEPEDLDLLYQIENDSNLWQVGTTNVPYSRYTLHDYIATSSDDIYADRQMRLIVEGDNGEAVGIADLVHFDPQHLRAEVGIVIQSNYRRKGYASAAIQELCNYAMRIIHLHQLYVIVASDNHPALLLFEKNGFKTQNTLSEWLFDGQKYRDAVLMQRFL